jgi:hypothetical protein
VKSWKGKPVHPAQEIAYYSHWITAPGRPRRFSTRFFVACAPAGQHGAHDRSETVHSVWVSPRDALERDQRKEIELIFPTRSTLTDLARCARRASAAATRAASATSR